MVARRKIKVIPIKPTQQNDDCDLCPLWESAETVCMWGVGPRDAQIMVVLDAPDSKADRSGKPLDGKAGKMLTELMEEAGINPKDCYITHTVKCKPPEGVAPSTSEIKTCKDYLTIEIEKVRPKYIIAVGALALKALTSKAKITETHGQVKPFVLGTVEAKLIPIFHPNMALRDPSKTPQLRKDMNRIGLIIRGKEVKEEDLHWEVIRSLDQWNDFIEELSECDKAAADVETTGLDMFAEGFAINTLQFGLPTGKNYSLPLESQDSPWKNKPKLRQQLMETLVEVIEDNDIEISGQNFKFDNKCLMAVYGVRFPLKFDTMLAHHLLDENSSHGLKEMATEFCDAPSYDIPLRIKLGQWKNEAERTQFYKYGCFDTGYTLQLRDIFRKKLLKEPGLRRLFYKLVMPAARMFEEIEMEGHYILVDKLKETAARLEKEKARLLKALNEAAGKEVNWDSPQQVGAVFYKKLKMPVLQKTAGGAPSTGESVLLQLQDKHPVAKMLMDYRGIAKNLSTYVYGWQELMHGEYLYLSTKLHGTVTGRYASRLHQVPRDPEIRSHISAPPGWTLAVMDYSQIELRLASQASGDQRMLQMFQTGGDVHKLTASVILGIAMELLTKEQRKMAKAVNFGFIYGMWWKKFRIYARDNYGVEVTDEEAEKFRKRFFELYSSFPKWHDRMKRVVRAFGQVVSLSGRIRHLPGVYSTDKKIAQEAERQGINSPIQGFGSGDLKAMAMVEIHETFSWEEVRIKGEVHDSILFWIRTHLLDKHVPHIKQIMESPAMLEEFNINMTVPIVVDVEIGPWGIGKPWEPK